jgi:hypothetical protein
MKIEKTRVYGLGHLKKLISISGVFPQDEHLSA